MSERNLVELVEEWQTGFFLVVGAALVGGLSVFLVRSLVGPLGGLATFFGAAILAFLAFSYLFYGR